MPLPTKLPLNTNRTVNQHVRLGGVTSSQQTRGSQKPSRKKVACEFHGPATSGSQEQGPHPSNLGLYSATQKLPWEAVRALSLPLSLSSPFPPNLVHLKLYPSKIEKGRPQPSRICSGPGDSGPSVLFMVFVLLFVVRPHTIARRSLTHSVAWVNLKLSNPPASASPGSGFAESTATPGV